MEVCLLAEGAGGDVAANLKCDGRFSEIVGDRANRRGFFSRQFEAGLGARLSAQALDESATEIPQPEGGLGARGRVRRTAAELHVDSLIEEHRRPAVGLFGAEMNVLKHE